MPPSIPDASEELFLTPRGSSTSNGSGMSTATASVSPPLAAPVSGKEPPSSPSSKPPEKVMDQVFDEMPQRDSPLNLMKFSASPGFPS